MDIDTQYTPQSELSDRITRFQKRLKSSAIDGALIIQKADLYYFSGTAQNAHLYIPAEGEPLLMVKKSLRRALTESALKNIVPLHSLKDLRERIFSINKPEKIGLEMDVIPARMFLNYQKMLVPSQMKDISDAVRQVRMIKSPYEIGLIRKSADLNFTMFSEAPNIIREGMTEVEIAGLLEAIYRRNGHQGACRVRGFNSELYYGHLASGWNLSYPSFFDGPIGGTGANPSYPQGAGPKKIGRNEPIMLDYAGILNGYIVDQARMFSIGPLSDKFVAAYEVALKIKTQIARQAIPGANGKDLYETAHEIAAESGLAEYLMGYEERVSFIAHGVGIELDELPVVAKDLDMTLEAGMVFALEPKFIFPEEGAIGIEDTFVVTEKGLEQLTYFDEALHVL
ncbi:Creatinase [uncultured Desulfobacterium sp.]|uniref:Creatinase n=1 Tax=uncultured Desulfobacterium sp. TaxID=201089 RepID=A0A445N2N0_9BACT|nr:Creatinase [uncultured Desulfobacterium sp.]